MRRRIFNFVSVVTQVFVWSYVIGFILFLFTLFYIGHTGTPRPDALHTIEMTSHGRKFYLTAWQYHLYVGAAIGVPACGLLAVAGGAFLNWRRKP